MRVLQDMIEVFCTVFLFRRWTWRLLTAEGSICGRKGRRNRVKEIENIGKSISTGEWIMSNKTIN